MENNVVCVFRGACLYGNICFPSWAQHSYRVKWSPHSTPTLCVSLTYTHTHTLAWTKNIQNFLQIHASSQAERLACVWGTFLQNILALLVLPGAGFACGILTHCRAKPVLDMPLCSHTHTHAHTRTHIVDTQITQTHILVIVCYRAFSPHVTQTLLQSAHVLDGALLGRRRKVIAEGIWRLYVLSNSNISMQRSPGAKTQAIKALL